MYQEWRELGDKSEIAKFMGGFSSKIYLNSHYQTHEVFITNKSGESTIYIKSRYVKHIIVSLSVFLLKTIFYILV